MITQPYSLQTVSLQPLFTCTWNCSVYLEAADMAYIRLFARSTLKNVEVVIERNIPAPGGYEQTTIDATLLSMEDELNWFVTSFSGLS